MMPRMICGAPKILKDSGPSVNRSSPSVWPGGIGHPERVLEPQASMHIQDPADEARYLFRECGVH